LEEELVWIQRVREGDTHYFQRLYHKHCGKLYGLCRRFTRTTQDAEEQLQEIFLKILEKMDSFQARSSFAAWAYRLAANHLTNFVNRTRTEAPLETAPEQPAAAADHDLAIALRKAVAELPEGFRNVFILHDQEGFRHEEIAEMLGCSPATSRSQLCRGRLALREKLKPRLKEKRHETA